MALVITLILGIFFLVGVLVVRFSKNSESIEHYSIAIACGAMVGIAVLDIIPEICEITTVDIWYLPIIGIAIGFLALVLLDKFIPEHEEAEDTEYSEENIVHIGVISSIAIVLHNIVEGMAVYSLASQSVSQGLMLMIGVGLHNIPMGMFIYSTLRHRTGWKRNVLIGLSVISTFVGGVLMMILAPYISDRSDGVVFGIALGMIIYIVVLELIPYVKRNKNKITSVICALIGLAIVLVSVFME